MLRLGLFCLFAVGLGALVPGEESSLTPSREPTSQTIRGWIADLDSNEYAARQRATQQLLHSGEAGLEALIEFAPSGSSEVHSRALAILENWLLSDRPKRVALATRGLGRWAESAPSTLARQAEALLDYARTLREVKAIERIRELGGRVDRDSETGLWAIKVGAWNGTTEDFAVLRDVQQVARVSLEESELDDAALKFLAGRAELKRLYLSGSKVAGSGLKDLTGLTSLLHLSLKNLPIEDEHLKRLPELPALRGLGLDGTKVGNEGLAVLPRYPKLETLWLEGSRVTDGGLAALQSLTELKTLYLANTGATGPGLAALRELRSLRYLSLMGAKLQPETCRSLGRLQQLETLGLDGTDVTDEQLADLAPLSGLKILWLSKTDLTDGAVGPLAKLAGLEKLHLTGSRLSTAGLGRLRKALPKCEVVFDESP